MSANASGKSHVCDVSVVVVSRNTRTATVECLDALKDAVGPLDVEFIAVDNASSDGSADAIARHDLAPWLIACGLDHGYRRAAVLGAVMALGRYIVLLRSDIVPEPLSISRLVAAADQSPKGEVWGGRIVARERRLLLGNILMPNAVSDGFLMVSGAAWPNLSCYDSGSETLGTMNVWVKIAKLLGYEPRLVSDAVAVYGTAGSTSKGSAQSSTGSTGAAPDVPRSEERRSAGQAAEARVGARQWASWRRTTQ